MDFNGYKRTKKFDIKRWLSGTNSLIYLLILIILVAVLLFALSTILRMHNNNGDDEDPSTIIETTSDIQKATEEETTRIAKNQSYSIKISKAKKVCVIYQLDSNMEFTTPVKAFYVSINDNVKIGKTTITEKSLWKKLNDYAFVRYSNRLDNAEYLASAFYYSQSIYNLNPNSYNMIGKGTTEGSIGMTVTNAKWIYENCGVNTTVEILEDFELSADVKIEEFKTLASWAYRDPIDE